MVFVKHNSLNPDIFFNPIFIPGFSGSRFFRVQVFQGPGFLGSGSRVQGPGSGSMVRVQVLEVAQFTYYLDKTLKLARSNQLADHPLCRAEYNVKHSPANICWSWRRLQHVFSVTILRPSRRLGRQKIVTLKTSWRRLEDMSWRCLEDISCNSILRIETLWWLVDVVKSAEFKVKIAGKVRQ